MFNQNYNCLMKTKELLKFAISGRFDVCYMGFCNLDEAFYLKETFDGECNEEVPFGEYFYVYFDDTEDIKLAETYLGAKFDYVVFVPASDLLEPSYVGLFHLE